MNSKKTIVILLCILIGIFVFLGIKGKSTSESEPVAENFTEVTKEPTEAPTKSPGVTLEPTKEPIKSPKVTKTPIVSKTPKVTSTPKEPKVTIKPTKSPKQKKSPKVTSAPKVTSVPKPTSAPKPTSTPKVKKEVTITIECTRILNKKDLWKEGIEEIIPVNGVYFKGVIPFDEKMSAYDVLKMACKKDNIALDSQYTPLYETYYIKGIGNLYEFDCGGESGWKYSVNGATPGVGCSSYYVEPEDSILFFYDYQL